MATSLAAGKRTTVFLREAIPSLGLAAGTSAKVVSIDGSTVTIRPTGVDDELPYEADELRMTKQAPSNPPKSPVRSQKPPIVEKATTRTRAQAPVPKPVEPMKPRATRARLAKPRSVTVTIFGSSDNEWSVAVTAGGRKPNQSRSVKPASVEAALRGLGDGAALEAAESVLAAAREEAARKVAMLSRELEAAKETLAALEAHRDAK
ncbi:DUF6319 family protein [Gordonia sp. (in: high G+C Gram-positive bacteria)]|uniref:DUF6319 family protein n=1 Tax=Gordonia sp. (in: high G+C Gram-positive bacteria) TaxID=84139 RepID=UPI002D1FA772|nr:DUF6319 family protein [Gordonia sp. (in: high G+C Gram-positive bacteria)]